MSLSVPGNLAAILASLPMRTPFFGEEKMNP
jgi:hypothetical protein